MMTREQALATFLDINPNDVEETNYGTFEADGEENEEGNQMEYWEIEKWEEELYQDIADNAEEPIYVTRWGCYQLTLLQGEVLCIPFVWV